MTTPHTTPSPDGLSRADDIIGHNVSGLESVRATPSLVEREVREKAAVILTPLIAQIFHGDNRTSKQIHEELDKALDSFVTLISRIQEATRREVLKEIETMKAVDVDDENDPESHILTAHIMKIKAEDYYSFYEKLKTNHTLK